VWGAAEVVRAAQGAAEVGEAGDEGAAQGLAVGPPFYIRGWSDRQPLFRGWSDRLGSRYDRQPLFRAWSDRPDVWSDRQLRPTVESPAEHGALAVV
jgi:hypothetical protein